MNGWAEGGGSARGAVYLLAPEYGLQVEFVMKVKKV